MDGTKIMGYTLIRKKVKNINLRIDKNANVYISAPFNLSDYQIEMFIKSKKDWIDKNIQKIDEYKKLVENLDVYENGSYIFFLSKKFRLILEKGSKKLEFLDDTLLIRNENLDSQTVRKIIYNDIYYVKAKKLFLSRLNYYLDLMGEKKDINLKISEIKSKWGLCIPKKREIRLNLNLIKKSELEIDSVIVHEIAHLKHPNHSKNFYNEIDKYFKNYKQVNKKLNNLV